MRISPKYFENKQDNNHCLQASVLIVLHTLGIKKSWEEVEKETDFEKDLYSWSINGAKMIGAYVDGVKLISSLNYRKLADLGESYLQQVWTKDWYFLQKAHSSSGFLREQKSAQVFIKSGGQIEERLTTKTDVETFLDRYFVIALIDPFKVKETNGNGSHFVVIFSQNPESFKIHDPGLPGIKDWIVDKDKFMRGFKNEIILIPKKGWKEEISRNDPCHCGSGKKYKHCHYPN